MGSGYKTVCKGCGRGFSFKAGGGFAFHLLHCDQCGREKAVDFAKLGEIHLRYLKGLPGPYSIATMEHDQAVRERFPGEPLSEEEYERKVERFAGGCRCGGSFSLTAPPRCPRCHTAVEDLDKLEPMVFYD